MTDVKETTKEAPATETPPVTETKITAEKPVKLKDPKKVAQGKKLAEISKQAKERKMRETIQQEMLEEKEGNWNIPFGYIVGTIGLSVAAGALYYGYDPYKIVKSATPTPTPTPIPPVKSNLDSFD